MLKSLKKVLIAMAAALLLVTGAFADETVYEKTEPVFVEPEYPEVVEMLFSADYDFYYLNEEIVELSAAPYEVDTEVGKMLMVPAVEISKAFGAEAYVAEDAFSGDKVILIRHLDVDFDVSIGSVDAIYNNEQLTLFQAPVFSGETAMISLDLLAYIFNADLFYDEASGIYGVSRYSDETDIITDNSIQTTYIGDSHYGWSMLNPKGMYVETMDSGDSFNIGFFDDNNNAIVIGAGASEDYTIDEVYDEYVSMFSGSVAFTVLEKDSENNSFHIQLKEENYYLDIRCFIKGDLMYAVASELDSTTIDTNEVFGILDSFTLEFRQEDCHDFSVYVDGMKEFKSELMNFTMYIPATTTGYEESKINCFSIYSDKINIALEIVSKSDDVVNAEEYITSLYEKNSMYINEKAAVVTDVVEKTYGQLHVFEFVEAATSMDDEDLSVTHIAFEIGDYQYRFSFSIDGELEEAEKIITSIMEKSVFNPIDEQVVGKIIDIFDTETELDGTYDEYVGRYMITIPETFTPNGNTYMDHLGRFNISTYVEALPASITADMFIEERLASIASKSAMKDAEEVCEILNIQDFETEHATFKVVESVTSYKDSTYKLIEHAFFVQKDSYLYMIVFGAQDVYFNEDTVELMHEIIGSFKENELRVK